MNPVKSPEVQKFEHAQFMLQEALEQDEKGNKQESLALYMEAAEFCYNAVST